VNATQAEEAPGRLESLRLLINTLNLPDGPDALTSVNAAAAWLRERGLPPVGSDRELKKLLDLREALREVLYANNGDADPKAAWEALRPFARGIALGVTIDPERGPELEPGGAGVDRLVGWVLAVVYDAVADGTWRRMRACKRETCRYAYYDSSKNGSRSWCDMTTCGNREKAQRRRARAHS
jgi:predicted RNA-binding Zn ribbon-like protein